MTRNSFMSGALLGALTVALLAGMAVISYSAAASPASVQDDGSLLRTIQVSGNGEVSVQPDRARVRLGVETESESAQDALQLNNEQMSSVIETLLQADIEESDIQSDVLRLEAMYESGEDMNSRTLTGYRASNIVLVTVRDLDNLGDLLDEAVAAGGNSLQGIQFEVSDQAQFEQAAREAAMSNAQNKAEQLAELAGVELGDVRTIIETGFSAPIVASAVREEALVAGVPVQPGSQTIQASVQVTWEIASN